MWPQYVYLMLVFVGLGIAFAKHGQPRSPWNAWEHLISLPIVLGLLYAGGFFDGLL